MYKKFTNCMGIPHCNLIISIKVAKLTTLLLIISLVQVSARGLAQRITLDKNKVSLRQVFREIRQQTGYDVLYQPDRLDDSRTIAAQFKEVTLDEVLKVCLEGLPLTYTIDDKTVVIKSDSKSYRTVSLPRSSIQGQIIRGMVTDENGNPVQGVSVKIKNSAKGTVTNEKGLYEISMSTTDSLSFSFIGYETQVVGYQGKGNINIQLSPSADQGLDEVVVLGF